MPRANTTRTVAATIACILAAGSGHVADAKPKRGEQATAQPNSTSRATREIVALTNRERTRRGLRALSIDGRCVSAISGHVADMAKSGFLSHSGSDGRGPDQRYRKYSPRSLGAGENLAYNSAGTANAFMQQWLNSSIHRGNILNPKYKGIGVAVRVICSGQGKERRCTYYAGQCFSL